MMKLLNRLGIVVVSFVLLFSFWTTAAFAHCGKCGMGEKHVGAETLSEVKTFQATVVCLGCTLKKEQGAKALCSLYGHKNALRTADGKIWTILENRSSTKLINLHEYAGKKVEITGKKFADAQVIEVESFKAVEE